MFVFIVSANQPSWGESAVGVIVMNSIMSVRAFIFKHRNSECRTKSHWAQGFACEWGIIAQACKFRWQDKETRVLSHAEVQTLEKPRYCWETQPKALENAVLSARQCYIITAFTQKKKWTWDVGNKISVSLHISACGCTKNKIKLPYVRNVFPDTTVLTINRNN